LNNEKSELNSIIEEVRTELRTILLKRQQLIEKLGSAFEKVIANRESICEEIKNCLKEEISADIISARTIESTNEMLGINEYVDASIYNINSDLYGRSLFYTIGYEFCVDAANSDAYKGLLINVEMNQDYMEVSHVLYLHAVEGIEISDK
jgi:uncharacterized protein YpuA (DUF1002 family)